MPEESDLKTYSVLSRLGWNGGTYSEGDTVEMEARFAEYYLSEKVLEESAPETLPPINEKSPVITPPSATTIPETEAK